MAHVPDRSLVQDARVLLSPQLVQYRRAAAPEAWHHSRSGQRRLVLARQVVAVEPMEAAHPLPPL